MIFYVLASGSMARTYAMLLATFGRDLGRLTHSYFRSECSKNDGYDGCYEAFLNSYADVNSVMLRACRGGYIDIVRLMISRGASSFNDGLTCACVFGHANIAQFMLECGASNLRHGFDLADHYGHVEVVQVLQAHKEGIKY